MTTDRKVYLTRWLAHLNVLVQLVLLRYLARLAILAS